MNKKNRKNTFYRTLSLSLGFSLLLSGIFSGSASAGTLPQPLPENPESAENTSEASSGDALNALLSETEAIHISSAADFLSFAESCTLDTWSQNKVFVLDQDLDLSETDFSPIPTFGGCLLGQGHTISGISLEGGSNDIGLFRYVQESGQIYQLTLSGIAQAERSHSGLAMLAGSNAGYLSDCHVSGSITGGDRVGGIVGTNELTGIISGCSTNGMISGRHLTGGIAGGNEGCIINCTNLSLVNTTADHNSIDLSEINTDTTITDFLTTENAASVTDIGGIAGSNPGIIKACTNEGTVGYQHVGYNIGGIAGSQTGYIEGCVNSGHLYGRKDIGGIAGQMEPSSELEYLEDTLQKLDTEFEKLHGLLTRLNSDASGTSERLTGQIDQLLNSVDGAQQAVDQILSDTGSHLDDFAALTDLTLLPSPSPLSLDFLDKLPRPSFSPLPSLSPWPSGSPWPSLSPWPSFSPEPSLSPTPSLSPSPAPTETPAPSETPTPSGTPTSSETPTPSGMPTPSGTSTEGAPASKVAEDSSDGSQKNPDTSGDETANSDDTTDSGSADSVSAEENAYVPDVVYSRRQTLLQPQQLDLAGAADGAVGDTSDGTEKNTPVPSPDQTNTPATTVPSETPSPSPSGNPFAAGWPAEWPTQWPFPTAGITLDDVMNSIDRDKIEDDLNNVQNNLYQDASRVLQSVQDTIGEQASLASFRLASARNSLGSSFSAITADMRILNSMMNEENQVLLEDFQAIVDEIQVIANIITEYETPDPDELLEDVSDEDQPGDITGKVMNCLNRGKIEGDLNTGGIAGSLSRENNLDPENELDLDVNISLNFRYKERMVIRQCKNSGIVEGKKDRTGGIAGEMTMGVILECTENGNVASEGSMTGGIAGYSTAVIRSCYAKCTLSGTEQIGGIAGYGSTISDCYSMVNIPEEGSFSGSIAGKVKELSSLENNFFVEGCPAGVDGVSYGGLAQPLSYEDFMALPGLPEMFQNIFLTFVADGQTVSVVTLEYGDSFHPDQLPSLPEKEGCTGEWESFDYDSITFDRTINAVYTEYITALESEQKIGERPILLIEGQFSSEDSLTLSPADLLPEETDAAAECWKTSLDSSGSGPYTFRYLVPETIKRPEILLYKDGTWRSVQTERDGSYAVFASEESDITFACNDSPSSLTPGRIALTAALGVLLLAVIGISIRHRKKKQHETTA